MTEIWQPQPGPQSLAIAAAFVDEILFGGARGGGKTSYLLGDYMQDIDLGVSWGGIFFRRSYPELEEAIKQSKEMYHPIGGQWSISSKTWTFPSGATLKMRHLDNEADAMLYQGHAYPWVGFDELGNWPNMTPYNLLKATVRSVDKAVTKKRMRSSANPGGPGHHAVKDYFINHNPRGYELIKGPDGMNRMFIPSLLTDNRILMEADPGYVNRLRSLGSPDMVKAWLEGDWNVITGAYFPEFSSLKHIIAPIPLNANLTRFMCGDWGSAKPFAFYWIAVSDGTVQIPADPFDFHGYPRLIPKGALIVYREWYGQQPGMANVGLRWPASRVAQGIKSRTHEHMSYRVLDPAAFKQDGGPSHAEVFGKNQVWFRPADNSRIPGWNQVRERLTGLDADPDVDNGVGIPMLYIFNTCSNLIRTLPALQHDKNDMEDCDTDGEDHGPDALRYGCMSRPWARDPVREAHPKRPPGFPEGLTSLQEMTLDDLWAARESREGVFNGL